jgi:hypothetical protein
MSRGRSKYETYFIAFDRIDVAELVPERNFPAHASHLKLATLGNTHDIAT